MRIGVRPAASASEPLSSDDALCRLERSNRWEARRRREQCLASEEARNCCEVHIDRVRIRHTTERMDVEDLAGWGSAIEVERWKETDKIDPGRADRRCGPIDDDVEVFAVVAEQRVVRAEVMMDEMIAPGSDPEVGFE
jgi:hypothetical protein